MKFLVPLQDLFYLLRCVVMLLAYDQRIKDAGGRFQRVYGRIDTEFRDLAAETVVASKCVKVVAGAGSVKVIGQERYTDLYGR